MESGIGLLILDSGDSIPVRYSLDKIVNGRSPTILGSIASLPLNVEHELLGANLTLQLSDGRKLRVIFDKPPQFTSTGGYF